MSKAKYHVQPPYVRRSHNAWKSFICAILIFATLCFLLLLLSWPCNYVNRPGEVPENGDSDSLSETENVGEETKHIDRNENKTLAKIQTYHYNLNYPYPYFIDEITEYEVTKQSTTEHEVTKQSTTEHEATKQSTTEYDGSKQLNEFDTTINIEESTTISLSENNHNSNIDIYHHDFNDSFDEENVNSKNYKNPSTYSDSTTYMDLTSPIYWNSPIDSTLQIDSTPPIDLIPPMDSNSTLDSTTPIESTSTSDLTTPIISTFTMDTTTDMNFKIYSNLNPSSICCNNTDYGMCSPIARNMMKIVNEKVEPCENFYQYACGGITEDLVSENVKKQKTFHLIKDQFDNINSKSELYKLKFKEYYKSCLNFNASGECLSHVRAVINNVRKFSPKVEVKLTEVLMKLIKYNFPVFFDIHTELMSHSKKFGLVITPEPPIPIRVDRDSFKRHYLTSINSKLPINLKKIYYGLKETNEIEGIFLNDTCLALTVAEVFNQNTAEEEINNTMNTLKTIMDHSRKLNEYLIDEVNNIPISISFGELKTKLYCDNVDWNLLMISLLRKNVSDEEEIKVYNLDYMIYLFNHVFNNETKYFHNAIMSIYLNHLFQEFLVRQSEINNRAKYCIQKSSEMMEDVSSALYLESFTTDEIDEICANQNKLFENIKSLDVSPNPIQPKLKTVSQYGSCYNETTLNLRFKETARRYVTFKNNFVEDSAILESRKRKLMFETLSLNPDEFNCMWDLSLNPYETEMKTIPELDIIFMPMAITPKEKYNRPAYMEMADLGFKIAKELDYYQELKHANPANNSKEVKFIIKDNKSDQMIEIEFDSEPSKMQRISDAYAVEKAFEAYKTQEPFKSCPEVNKDQVFFIYLVQQMCTTQSIYDSYPSIVEKSKLHPLLRANSLTGNSQSYSATFKCKDIEMQGKIKA